MFKKILAIILSICIFSGYATVTTAQRISGIDVNVQLEVLKALGMVNKDYDQLTVEFDKIITRADFAVLAAGVLKRDYDSDSRLYYHDISSQHWAAESIATLVETGLLKITPDRLFNPNDTVSMNDAAEIIVNALGYGFNIESSSTFNSIELADNLGILRNISNRDELNFADVISMLYNALITEVLEFSTISGNKIEYENDGEIYLEKEYSISFKRGIVEGVDGVSANGEYVGDGKALISGIEYETDGLNLTDLLGCEIVYIYDFSNDEDAGNILWVKKYKTEELTILCAESEVVFDAANYQVTYSDVSSGKRRSVRISNTVDVVYNDEYVVSGIDDLLNSQNIYSMKLIKNSGEQNYSKVILYGYQNILVESVELNNQVIYDRITKGNISLRNADRVDIYRAGTLISLSDLKPGDLLTVYSSISQNRIKIDVSNTVIGGTISSIRTEYNYQYLTVGDVEYRCASAGAYWDGSVGVSVSMYIDANGLVAYIEKYIAMNNIAFMIRAYYDMDEDKLFFKLFKNDGTVEKVKCADTVRIDGIRYKSMEQAFNSIGGKDVKSSLMMYKTNAEGFITQIYFPGTDGDANLKVFQNNVTGTYRTTGRLGRKSLIDNDTIIFAIPNNPKEASDQEFRMISKSDMMGDTSYSFSTYSVRDDVDYEDIVVLHDYVRKTSGAKGILVTKIYTELNHDDEVVDVIEGYAGATLTKLTCAPSCSLSGVNRGSYVTYELDNFDDVRSVSVRCDIVKNIKPLNTDLHQTQTFSSGYVNKLIGSVARIGDSSGAAFDTLYDFTSSIPVLVYNTEEDLVEVGSVANLKSYEVAGSNCSFVFTHIRGGVPYVYVVYE